jgi:hypothetical protein
VLYSATTGIEVGTLCIAAVAAVASVVGAVVSSITANRHNHQVWLRDLRTEIYSRTIECAQTFAETCVTFNREWQSILDPSEREQYVVEHQGEIKDVGQELANAVYEVLTFGAKKVSIAVGDLSGCVTNNLLCLGRREFFGTESDPHKAFRKSLNDFRWAVRESLGVSEN